MSTYCDGNVCVFDGDAKILVQNLSLNYFDKPAIRDVSLQIPPCSITSIIGPSGCGKSSFLSSLNRMTDLIPGCTVTGKILVGGENILDNSINPVQLRKRVGMIFQKPNPFPVSISKNITEPLKYHGVKNSAARDEKMIKALVDVGLWEEVKDRLNSSALNLSGGQQQRLCIARAIALEPEVLLLDEPCSSLDPMATAIIEDLILNLRERFTLVVVTHNLGQARRISFQTALFWMVDGIGTLLESGKTEQMFSHPTHQISAAYIDGRLG